MGGEAGESLSGAGVTRACLKVVFYLWGQVSVVVCHTVSLHSSSGGSCVVWLMHSDFLPLVGVI